MIDIHSHILPELDDGAQNLEESLEMARLAVKDGIHTVIATPHHANGVYMNEKGVVEQAVFRLNSELESHGIPLKVLTGQEIRVYDRLIDDWYQSQLATLHDTPYILIEFPSNRIPKQVEELFHELRVLQLTPIIAHPERNKMIMENPDKLQALVEAGALCQVTAQSLTGLFGKKIQSLSVDLCKRNLIHFLASDAHDVSRRSFGFTEAKEQISKQIGIEYYDYYVENAEMLIQGKKIHALEPKHLSKKWFQFWK